MVLTHPGKFLLTNFRGLKITNLSIKNFDFLSFFHHFFDTGFFCLLFFFLIGLLKSVLSLFANFRLLWPFSLLYFAIIVCCSWLCLYFSDVELRVLDDFIHQLLSSLTQRVQFIFLAACITNSDEVFLMNLVGKFGVFALSTGNPFSYKPVIKEKVSFCSRF